MMFSDNIDMCMDREMACYKTTPAESVPRLWEPGDPPHISNTFLPLSGLKWKLDLSSAYDLLLEKEDVATLPSTIRLRYLKLSFRSRAKMVH